MMAIIVGTFTVCWIPFAVMFMLMPTCETTAKFFFETEEGAHAIEWITWIGKVFIKMYIHLIKNNLSF